MHYCDHFASISSPKISHFKASCEQCSTYSPLVWICLSKGCGYMACQKDKFRHMQNHEKQNKKTNHSVFINPISAQIKCLACKIEILDFTFLTEDQYKKYSTFLDPLAIRLKFKPSLNDKDNYVSIGKIQSSIAHKKSNRGLCGLENRNNNKITNCIVQYFSNIPYYKKIIKTLKIDSKKSQNKKLVQVLAELINKIWDGENKCISSNDLNNLVLQKLPQYKGYKRKDPFEIFTLLLNCMHEELRYYESANLTQEILEELIEDEWKVLKNEGNKYKHYSPIINPLLSEIKYVYECKKCKYKSSFSSEIMGVKLQFPKKRKIVKQLEQQYEKRNYSSPNKTRSKSLLDRLLGTNDDIPLGLIEMFFYFFDNIQTPFDKLKQCIQCKEKMQKKQTYYNKLPNILLLHIPRMNKDGYSINSKNIDFSLDSLDMSGFVGENYKGETKYQFCSAVCLNKENEFVTIVKNYKNKQLHQIKNDKVKLYNENCAPYLICYMLKNRNESLYRNIKSNVKISKDSDYCLPEFWIQTFKYFEPGPLLNQKTCKHGFLKPKAQSKVYQLQRVPKQIYEALIQKFGGRMYKNQVCQLCSNEIHSLVKRKKLQKQYVSQLDNYVCKSYCMISCMWLRKWTDFLYNKNTNNYFVKRSPPPGPINNYILLENQERCKPGLKKGEDYKITNFYVWHFFKQMYGGGPEIQYKNKSSQQGVGLDMEVLKDIDKVCKQLKEYSQQELFINKIEYKEIQFTKQKSTDSDYNKSTRQDF